MLGYGKAARGEEVGEVIGRGEVEVAGRRGGGGGRGRDT